MKIRKAVIPAAGLGTRFLPATKALPKEMLPIIDIPTIQYIVEEAVKSGIEEILIITNPYKQSLEDHFDYSYELEHRLSSKPEVVNMLRKIADLAKITFIRQKEPKGLGHAILCAKGFVGNEPFAILLGDDIVKKQGSEEALEQLMKAYEHLKVSVLGVQQVAREEVYKYGIIHPSSIKDREILMKDIVEKPDVASAPSNYAVLGRYILTPAIFPLLETLKPGKNGELQLTDAIKELMKQEKVYAYDFVGLRYDVGDKFGFLKANLDFALERADLKEEIRKYILDVAKKL